MIPWASPTSQSKWHHDRFSCFRTGGSRLPLYFTMGALLPLPKGAFWPPSNTWFTGQPESSTQTLSRSVQLFLHRWLQRVPIVYNRMPLSTLKIAHTHGGIRNPSNTWFLGSTRVLNSNGISIGSAIFAWLTSVSVTDHTTGSVRIDHICTHSTGNAA